MLAIQHRTARGVAATLLTLALTLAPATAMAKLVRFALVLGNNVGDATSEPLRHAERDAAKFHDVLAELGDIDEENLVLLTGATADDVRGVLAQFEARFREMPLGTQDRAVFILYYSGHGTADYLELGGTHLPLDELRTRLRESGATVRLAIVDSCYSGAMIRTKGGKRAPSFPLAVDDRFRSEGYAFMTSSSADERSQESDEVRGSFFTHYLTSGLRGGADFSDDGLVTLGEVYQYAYHQTLKRSATTGAGPQHPHFDYEISGEGELVLTRLVHAGAVLQFPEGSGGEYLVYAPGTGTVVAEVTLRDDKPSALALPPGDYTVFERGSGTILATNFAVADGEMHVFDRMAMAPISASEYQLKGPLVHVMERQAPVSVSPKVGYQGIFDAGLRDELMAPAVLFGIETSWDRVAGVEWLTLTFDVLAAYAEQEMRYSGSTGRQDLFQLNFGASAYYTLRFWDFSVGVGPRLAGVYIDRDVSVDGGPMVDESPKGNSFSFSPGAGLRLGYRPVDWLAVTLEGRTSWLRVTLDGTARDMAYGEAFLALNLFP